MSKKEQFIEWCTKASKNYPMSEDVEIYFKALCGSADREKSAFTENGRIILQYMKNNKDAFSNLFKAKDIGEGLNVASRTASGGMRKLVADGYLEKMGENPVTYSLTEKGIAAEIEAE